MSMDIDNSTIGNMNTTRTDFSVNAESTKGPLEQKRTTLTQENFEKYLGYFNSIPELKSLVTVRAKWVIGKGYKAEGEDKKILEEWRGYGKDTTNGIIKNMVMVYHVGGDFFGEIIRDDSVFRKILTWFGIVNPNKPINLKPLDPSSINTILNSQGMIEEYEQISKIEGRKPRIIKSENMFHLPRNRFADEGNGQSIIPAIEKIILARGEALADIKTVFHRYVKPLWIWQLNTDNVAKIKAFKVKADKTVENGENIYIPKGAAIADRMSVPQFSTLDPLPYIQDLTNYFYEATNTPDIIVGSAKQTVEASAKILMLTFEQSIREEQLFIMDNFKSQLGIEIKLEFPTPIEANLIEDNKKDGPNNFQKNDTTVGSGK